MKLRIKGNTLRLRLTQGEMSALAEQGTAEDRIEFPGGATLVYRLQSDNKTPVISAKYGVNIIEVRVPSALCARWSGTDLVTLSATQAVGSEELTIVLEKDFACLAPRAGEDESDNFPHPLAGTAQSG